MDPIILVGWEIISLFAIIFIINLACPKIRKPKYTQWILVVLTVVLIPLQVLGYIQLAAYSSGNLTPPWEESLNIQPGETYSSDTISNVYTTNNLQIKVQTTGPSIEFYIIDVNDPFQRYYARNSSLIELEIQLPYLLTDILTPAKWIIVLENTLHRNAVSVSISIYLDWLDLESPRINQLAVVNTIPQTVLIVVWICFIVGQMWHNRFETNHQDTCVSDC